MARSADDPVARDDIDLLDGYLGQLQSGWTPDRDRFLADHPNLKHTVESLEALDGLAAATIDALEPAPVSTSVVGAGIGEFGKFELLEEIGRGGMGVVYKARQTDLDRIVAVKMILEDRWASGDEVRRFEAEARMAACISHANVVGVYEAGAIGHQHYLSMRYVAGDSLADLLRDGPLDGQTAAECLTTVARAIDHLHANGIVHRDLKPSNILIDDVGDPHVTDFGLAKLFAPDSGMTQTGAIIGTPAYMAPEQAAGEGSRVSHRSDVYSLGAILYEMLTGRPPFREDNPLDTLVQVVEREPMLPRSLNPSAPRPLELICLRCLEKSPESRYRSAAAVADDLERYLRGEPIEARPAGLAYRLRAWTRRETALSVRLAVLAALFLVELIDFHILGVVDGAFHAKMTMILAAWAVSSFACQRLLRDQRRAPFVPFAWGATDAILLLLASLVANGPSSPLLIGYLLLIAASGLWARVRLVVFMTASSLACYALLLMDASMRRPELNLQPPAEERLLFATVVCLMGLIVGYQVQRVSVLSRYFERRRGR